MEESRGLGLVLGVDWWMDRVRGCSFVRFRVIRSILYDWSGDDVKGHAGIVYIGR